MMILNDSLIRILVTSNNITREKTILTKCFVIYRCARSWRNDTLFRAFRACELKWMVTRGLLGLLELGLLVLAVFLIIVCVGLILMFVCVRVLLVIVTLLETPASS